MDRRRHCARRQAPRRVERHSRTDDAGARPPSRPGARRRRYAVARRLAAGQFIARNVAGAARRASRQLCRRGAQPACRGLPRGGPCGAPPPPTRGAEPHAAIYGPLDAILDQLDDPLAAAASIARFELDFLAELGFGLDLSCCAATGTTADLIYVSPRSGRAVSRAGGEDYRDKLLALPAFLRDDAASASAADVASAFAMTGFFLDRHAFAPRGLAVPEARARFVTAIAHAFAAAASRSA